MDNPYSPPAAAFPEPEFIQAGFGEYSSGRAFGLGWKTYKDHFPLATAIAVVWWFLYGFAAQTCVGFIIVPHLMAGFTIAGLSLVRNIPKFESLFQAFEVFGKVFVTGIIFGLIYLALIALTFGLYLLLAFMTGVGSVMASKADQVQEMFSHPEQSPFVMTAVAIIIGLVFLFQFYVVARLQLTFPLIIERRYEIMDAMKKSWQLTKGKAIELSLVKLLIDFVMPVVGILTCCVGALVTYPLAMTIQGAIVYLYLGDQIGSVPMNPSVQVPQIQSAPVTQATAPMQSVPPTQSTSTQTNPMPRRDDSHPYS